MAHNNVVLSDMFSQLRWQGSFSVQVLIDLTLPQQAYLFLSWPLLYLGTGTQVHKDSSNEPLTMIGFLRLDCRGPPGHKIVLKNVLSLSVSRTQDIQSLSNISRTMANTSPRSAFLVAPFNIPTEHRSATVTADFMRYPRCSFFSVSITDLFVFS